MTPEEKRRIESWGVSLAGPVEIRVFLTEDERTSQLSGFCDELAELVPNIRLVKKEEDHGEKPSIGVGTGIRYFGVPQGKELEPFLALLSDLDKGSPSVPAHLLHDLEQITVPVTLRLYVSPQCLHCPFMARQILPLGTAAASIRVRVIDCLLFPEMAQSQEIRSVPTLLLDEAFRWTGAVPLEELVEVMKKRDPAKLGAASLEGMLREGKASEVAGMMLERGLIFPSFIDLLVHEKLFLRLGAMVIMEEIAERNRRLAGQVVGPLWARFEEADDRVQGDILHVLGETGSLELTSRLRAIRDGSYHPEVKDAAQEALEKIQSG
jgi:hypothetical protein